MNEAEVASVVETASGTSWIVPVVIGVVVGALIALAVQWFRRYSAVSLSEILVQEQKTCDVLDKRVILQWAKDNKHLLKDGTQVAVFRPTDQWADKLGWKDDERPDPAHNVVLCIRNAKSGDVETYQMISFGEMDPGVLELFGDEDIFFLDK